MASALQYFLLPLTYTIVLQRIVIFTCSPAKYLLSFYIFSNLFFKHPFSRAFSQRTS